MQGAIILKSRTNILKKQIQEAKIMPLGPYSHLSRSELIENLKQLIKNANSSENLNPKPAREILLEDRR